MSKKFKPLLIVTPVAWILALLIGVAAASLSHCPARAQSGGLRVIPMGYCYSTSLSSATKLTAFTCTMADGGTIANEIGFIQTATICVYVAAVVVLDNGAVPTGTPPAVVQGGYKGLDFQAVYAGTPASYNPIVQALSGNYTANPVFYGMVLFSKLQGQQTVALSISGSPYVRAMATKGANGNANILAVNNNPTNAIPVTIDQSSGWSTANVWLLTSNTGCSDSGAILGGATIGESGTFTGAPFSSPNGQTISIPPCGAILAQIQP